MAGMAPAISDRRDRRVIADPLLGVDYISGTMSWDSGTMAVAWLFKSRVLLDNCVGFAERKREHSHNLIILSSFLIVPWTFSKCIAMEFMMCAFEPARVKKGHLSCGLMLSLAGYSMKSFLPSILGTSSPWSGSLSGEDPLADAILLLPELFHVQSQGVGYLLVWKPRLITLTQSFNNIFKIIKLFSNYIWLTNMWFTEFFLYQWHAHS